MRDNEPTPMSGTPYDPAAEARVDAADRHARAERIRRRSVELIEALGADHPLVAEALARADALDADLPCGQRPRAGAPPERRPETNVSGSAGSDEDQRAAGDRSGHRHDAEGTDAPVDEIDLRSSADVRR